jgi:tetratricopeptide (TPR) repeat protein
MDGRLLRKWCVFGGLMAVAVVGCRSNKTNPFGQMPNGGGPALVNMPMPNNNNGKSFWGGSNSSPASSVPVEVATESSKKPASPEALVAIANVQLDAAFDEKTAAGAKEGLLDSARKGYQKALHQAPKNKAAMLGMAQFYARTNDREKAVEQYKKCLTQHPEAEIAHEVAVAHARWKDWNGAVAWCDYTLKIDPENRSVKKTKGFCQAMASQWDDAFKTLCQIMPEAQARHNLAGLLDQMGQMDKCKLQLQLAVKADPNYAPAAGFLAELDQPRDPNGVRQASDMQPTP